MNSINTTSECSCGDKCDKCDVTTALLEQVSAVSATKYKPLIWAMSSFPSNQDNRSETVHIHMEGTTIFVYGLAPRLY